MITHHAARLRAVSDARGALGMPIPRCGYLDDGHNLAIAWDARFVDCTMCLYELARITYVSGMETTVRHTPEYIEHHAGTPYRPAEFVGEHPRGRPWAWWLKVVSFVLLAAAAFTVLALGTAYASDDPEPTPSQTPVKVTQSPEPAPTRPPPMPQDDILAIEVIWTGRH